MKDQVKLTSHWTNDNNHKLTTLYEKHHFFERSGGRGSKDAKLLLLLLLPPNGELVELVASHLEDVLEVSIGEVLLQQEILIVGSPTFIALFGTTMCTKELASLI